MRASPDVLQADSRGTLGQRAGRFQRRPHAPNRLPFIAGDNGDSADDLGGGVRGIAIALAISIPMWAAIIALCWAKGYWL